MSWWKSTEQLIIPWRKGDLLHSSGFETHCCKEVERQVGKMLCFPQRSFLHYVMLLKIEAKLTRWAPSMGQACIHDPANSPWCGVTCREVTGVAAGGSLVESPKALGSMSVGQLLSEGSLMGWAALLVCLKTNLKAVQKCCCFSAPLTLTTGVAYGSPGCSKTTFQSGPDLVHENSRQFVGMPVHLQGVLSLPVTITQVGCWWNLPSVSRL